METMDRYGSLLTPDASMVRPLRNEALRPIFEVNAQFLAAISRSSTEESLCSDVAAIRNDVISLNATAREQIVRGPLLIDAAFEDGEKWTSARRGLRGSAVKPRQRSIWFPPAQAAHLAQSTLLLTWYLVRTYPDIAALLLGVQSECAGVIVDLSIGEVQEIAVRHSDWIRPRWDRMSATWRSLIDTARNQDESSVGSLVFRALHLFTADYCRSTLISKASAIRDGQPTSR